MNFKGFLINIKYKIDMTKTIINELVDLDNPVK